MRWEQDPAKYLPDVDEAALGGAVVLIDLNQPMQEILATLRYPIKTRLSLTGPMIVARDLAHAKIRARLEAGEGMPHYFKDHPVYYAGPAKTAGGLCLRLLWSDNGGPHGFLCRSIPSPWRLAGQLPPRAIARKKCVRPAPGTAAFISARSAARRRGSRKIASKKLKFWKDPELGMEAIWRIEVENFPAFIVIDNKGNDFFKELIWGEG